LKNRLSADGNEQLFDDLLQIGVRKPGCFLPSGGLVRFSKLFSAASTVGLLGAGGCLIKRSPRWCCPSQHRECCNEKQAGESVDHPSPIQFAVETFAQVLDFLEALCRNRVVAATLLAG